MCQKPRLVPLLSLMIGLASSAHAEPTDLLVLVDETGGMAAEIAALQAGESSIIAPIAIAALGDVAFGVSGYRDFMVSPYGDPGDMPYTQKSTISTNIASFQAGLNGLSPGGGGDAEEANLHALHTAATVSPGRRAGATRVILWIGDAPGHDGDLEPSYSSCCSPVGLGDATSALISADITVYAFSTDPPGLDATGQATSIVSATGGTLSSGLAAGALVSEIAAVIEGPLAATPVPALAQPLLGILALALMVSVACALHLAPDLTAPRRTRRDGARDGTRWGAE